MKKAYIRPCMDSVALHMESIMIVTSPGSMSAQPGGGTVNDENQILSRKKRVGGYDSSLWSSSSEE